MTPVIEIHDLTKTFGAVRALDHLDLSVEAGEVHGFLGPNGAGKTTTLRVLLGLLRPDSGAVRLLGGDPWRDVASLHRRLAYVPGDVSLWPNLTGGEVVDLLGRLRGGLNPARRTELVERFDLDLSKRSRAYSKGNRQKVALVAALSSDVELLLLDEPTAGLDPLMEDTFRRVIGERRAQGVTVLLSSHILAEAEALSDRVSIIRRGQVVETGTLAALRHLTRTAVTVDVTAEPRGLAGLAGVHELTVERHAEALRIRCEVEPAAMDALLGALAGVGVRSLSSAPPTLEELFLRHYSDDLAAAAQGPAASGSPDGGAR
ncbi:MAG TPA: ABC transporter ATP-binding protein [Actinotalea sp.]|nr:ABC transporter ATP-binding protein [Actinotalea sp.]